MKQVLSIIFLICIHTDSKILEKISPTRRWLKYLASDVQCIVFLPEVFILFTFRSSIICGQGSEVEVTYKTEIIIHISPDILIIIAV